MDTEVQLNQLAERYRSQGYQVVVYPEPKDLPDFAKTFQVEIVARRADGCAIVSAKKSPREFTADQNAPMYAEAIEQQPGWRFDVVIFGANNEPTMPEKRDAREPSDDDFHLQIDSVSRLLDANLNQALVLAWSVLEAAMRRRLQTEGEEAGWGTSPRTMLNVLLSVGALSLSTFRELEDLFHVRSAIVHGFSVPAVERSAVNFLLGVTRNLLEDSKLAKQPA